MQRRSHFIEKTLSGITQTLERSLFAEAVSLRPGFFQSLDPRLKIITTLILLIGVSMAHNLWIIICVYLLVLVLALVSAVPAEFFIRRVWLAVPLFTGVIALPALFLIPGQPLVHLPMGLTITQTGARSVLFLLLRVATSLSLVLLLIMTTPWNTVLGALGVLKVPDVFILVLGMTFRYIYLLLHIANDMFLSRKSRVIGKMSRKQERHMLAAIGATLLGKSLNMSSEVYLAMVSRGYRGTVVTLKPFRMQGKDWLWATFFSAISVSVFYLGR
jgi:cobalt/nickel transport system permease protein